ncbi:hypothetical protein CCR75_003648 [Bremia lactucae]|uniref:Uncharacterized protein n=1 Tax=Bremia lactucae TaxID=4779 RepID=A0A976IL42_BRELC|nr:hypothetical protein CCR75_003648 [Bremia lactucae]
MSTLCSVSSAHVLGHKRRRTAEVASMKSEDACDYNLNESGCATSGESSGDESDCCYELDDDCYLEDENFVAPKRRRDLDYMTKSVRLMKAQVDNASAQLKELAALVAVVAAGAKN